MSIDASSFFIVLTESLSYTLILMLLAAVENTLHLRINLVSRGIDTLEGYILVPEGECFVSVFSNANHVLLLCDYDGPANRTMAQS